jgi:hypothetical protein
VSDDQECQQPDPGEYTMTPREPSEWGEVGQDVFRHVAVLQAREM